MGIETGVKQVMYKKNDVYLVKDSNGISEIIIVEVSNATGCVKAMNFKNYCNCDNETSIWLTAIEFHKNVLGRLGSAKKQGYWPFSRTVIV